MQFIVHTYLHEYPLLLLVYEGKEWHIYVDGSNSFAEKKINSIMLSIFISSYEL
jgi:hypothetical protein